MNGLARGAPRHRTLRHAAVVVGLSLAGVLTVGRDDELGAGVGRLGRAWDTLSPVEQADICRTIDTSGQQAAADQLLEETDAAASIEDAELFVKGLACHIRVAIDSG